jgi:CO/xanthine dehydrogenase Mo-binding subunit
MAENRPSHCTSTLFPLSGGPFGGRGVGEPPLIGTGPAILPAIHDMIGKPIRELPATPKRIWRAIAC